jgi:hypothetical protein
LGFHSFWSSRFTTAPVAPRAFTWACSAWASSTAAPVLVRRCASSAAKLKLPAVSCSNSDALLTTASTAPICAATAGSRARTAASSPRSAWKAAAPGRQRGAFGCRGLRVGLRAAVVHGHAPAAGGQGQRNLAAQAFGGAGHEHGAGGG